MIAQKDGIDRNDLARLMELEWRWSQLLVSVDEVSVEQKALLQDLSQFDPNTTIPLLAAFLTLPEYQSNGLRFEILTTLATTYCAGQKIPTLRHVQKWFGLLGESRCANAEDPAEDVFVSRITFDQKDYLLLEGTYEGAAFYTQRVLDVIATAPDQGKFGAIKQNVRTMLTLSDHICRQAALQRYQLGSDERHAEISLRGLPTRDQLMSRTTFDFSSFEEYGLQRSYFEPFLLTAQRKRGIEKQSIRHNSLQRFPLMALSEGRLGAAAPSSISIAVREFIFEKVFAGELTDVFDNVLASKYSKLIKETPLLGGARGAPVRWKHTGAHRWAQFSQEVDRGYYFSYHLFLPSLRVHVNDGFGSVHHVEQAVTEILQESVRRGVADLASSNDFRGAAIILVGCDWGKGYSIDRLDIGHPACHFQHMSVADLIRLSWLEDMNPSYFWRIQAGLRAITDAGVQIRNPNGILNLIGWVRTNHGHFVPHEDLPERRITPDQPLSLYPPTNLLRDVRCQADQAYDQHYTIDNSGNPHLVQRVSPHYYFASETRHRLYASKTDVACGLLTSVYEGTFQIWMSIVTSDTTHRHMTFRLWEMANEWLHRIGDLIDKSFSSLSLPKTIKVYVQFADSEIPSEVDSLPSRRDLIATCRVESHSERNACKVVFGTGFLRGFQIAENIAERLVVRYLAEAFLRIFGVGDREAKAATIEDSVVPNNEARSFHLFHAQDFSDYVHDAFANNVVAIDSIDEATARLGIGWRVLGRSQDALAVVGRSECNEFLGKVVDALIGDIIDQLSSFERRSTLIRLINNSEKARAEATQWTRTSAALIGLHGDNEETKRVAAERTARFAEAGITSRVLCEMALCACPMGEGAQLSDMELGGLLALVSLVVQFGGLSDAIYYNALYPEIRKSALGNLLFRNDFGELVVNPTLTRMFGDKFVAEAPSQKKNYGPPRVIRSTHGLIDDEFLTIWRKEMGFTLDQGREIVGILEDEAIGKHTTCLRITRDEYFRIVCAENVNGSEAGKFLQQFTLATRPQWQQVPNGYATKDIYPWRFGRRLSFHTRPILQLNHGKDPELLVPPGALRRGLAMVFDGAHNGRFDQSFFRTTSMRNHWWGRARDGHGFNMQVAQALSAAGWNIRTNIGLPEILNANLGRNYGDVDVLAWKNKGCTEVLVVECKDLAAARNYSEIAALLTEYQGVEKDGEPDSLKRHLNRVAILKDNIEQLGKFTRLSKPTIVSCLICSGVVPMQYARIRALAETRVGTIRDILAN